MVPIGMAPVSHNNMMPLHHVKIIHIYSVSNYSSISFISSPAAAAGGAARHGPSWNDSSK